MEKDDPLFALFVPVFDQFMLIQKGMDIAMPMRFGIDEEGILLECKMCTVVDHGGYLFLFHDCDLIFIHAKVVIFLKKL